MQEDLADLFLGDAVVDRAAHMAAQLVLAFKIASIARLSMLRVLRDRPSRPHTAPQPCSVMKSWIGLPMSSWLAASARST